MQLKTRAPGFPQQRANLRCLWFITLILCCHLCQSEKIRYASKEDCDRHSLDAVYHEKFKLITHNIFTDSKEFIIRVMDLVADSLTTIMAELPDRDVSDNQERKVHTQFQNMKSSLTSKMKKMEKNITSTWDELAVANFDLMYDNGKSSLEDYLNKTIRMADSYWEARKSLDVLMSAFVGFVKMTVREGLYGIEASAEDAVRKEEEKGENGTEGASDGEDIQAEAEGVTEKEEEEGDNKTEDVLYKENTKAVAEDSVKREEEDIVNKTAAVSDGDGSGEKIQKSQDEVLQEKMVEIAKMIVPGFLGKLTVDVIEKKVDIKKPPDVKAEDRQSVLEDIVFDTLMVKNRIRSIVETDAPRDKGSVDLARRSIYTYWADTADNMYKVKLQSKKADSNSYTSRLYYRNLWKDEDQIVETLLNLMEIYP